MPFTRAVLSFMQMSLMATIGNPIHAIVFNIGIHINMTPHHMNRIKISKLRVEESVRVFGNMFCIKCHLRRM